MSAVRNLFIARKFALAFGLVCSLCASLDFFSYFTILIPENDKWCKMGLSRRVAIWMWLLSAAFGFWANAQNPEVKTMSTGTGMSELYLIPASGILPEFAGKAVQIRFAIYENKAGGLPLWKESQDVNIGTDGHYSVLLGATSTEGLPQELFREGDARWIETLISGPQVSLSPSAGSGDRFADMTPTVRSLLSFVPYAFKAIDADTLAGRAATDYVTRDDLSSAVHREVHAAAVGSTTGPITSLTAGNGLTGGGSGGNVTLSLMEPVSIANGGTGAATAVTALATLGGQRALPGVTSDGSSGVTVAGGVVAGFAQIGNTTHLPLGTLDAKSPVCGAVGNGRADDTVALQTCITYALAHNMSMYLPTGTYLVTKSINISSGGQHYGFWINGDGGDKSVIQHNLTEAFPVLDFGGCSRCGVQNIGITPTSWTSSQATAGILATKGTTGGTGGDEFTIFRSLVAAGNSPTTAAVVLFNVDLSKVKESRIYGFGAALVAGAGMGTAKSVVSKFYAMPTIGDATNYYIMNDTLYGSQAPPLQLTGSSAYAFDDTYVALIGNQAASAIIEVGRSPGLADSIFGKNIRTENQSSAKGVAALLFDSSSWGGDMSGKFHSDRAGVAVKGASSSVTLAMYKIMFEAYTLTGLDFPGTIISSSIEFGSGTVNFGLVGALVGSKLLGSRWSTDQIYSAIGFHANDQIIGWNGNASYSDIAIKGGITVGSLKQAGVVVASADGTLSSATSIPSNYLASPSVSINGKVCTLGSACTVPVASNQLSGTALPPQVVESSLSAIGTVLRGTWNASPIANKYLENSSINVNGAVWNLGGTYSTPGGVGTPYVLCRNATDKTVTGSTRNTTLFYCTIPANALTANSTLKIHSTFTAGSSNTGTCSAVVALTNTNAATGGASIVYPFSANGGRTIEITATCSNRGSTSKQICGSEIASNTNQVMVQSTTPTIDMSGTSYIEFVAISSAGGKDTCALNEADVTVWP